jgi:hypothetical protein
VEGEFSAIYLKNCDFDISRSRWRHVGMLAGPVVAQAGCMGPSARKSAGLRMTIPEWTSGASVRLGIPFGFPSASLGASAGQALEAAVPT